MTNDFHSIIYVKKAKTLKLTISFRTNNNYNERKFEIKKKKIRIQEATHCSFPMTFFFINKIV